MLIDGGSKIKWMVVASLNPKSVHRLVERHTCRQGGTHARFGSVWFGLVWLPSSPDDE